MINKDKKKISERPFLIFLIALLSEAVFLAVLAFFNGEGLSNSIGNYYLYGGSIVALIGFAFINKGSNKWDRGARFIKNDNLFKKVRAEEKPFEKIVWSVIFAGVLIASIGYLLNQILVG